MYKSAFAVDEDVQITMSRVTNNGRWRLSVALRRDDSFSHWEDRRRRTKMFSMLDILNLFPYDTGWCILKVENQETDDSENSSTY